MKWLFSITLAAGSLAAQQQPPPSERTEVVSVSPLIAALRQDVTLKVANLKAWLPESQPLPTNLLPFLSEQALPGCELLYIDRASETIKFTLRRDPADEKSRNAWKRVLGGFGDGIGNGPRLLSISVGRAGEAPLPSQAKLRVNILPQPWAFISVVVILSLFAGFLRLAYSSDILRAPASAPGQGSGSYSIAQCQMAWWTFVVLGCFTAVWLVTGDLSLPKSSLVLIGISGATGLASVLISSDKPQRRVEGSFLKQILSDQTGVSFHRFQIFAWTLALSIVYISSAINDVSLPEFDATLLTLMGIGSGTYLGFKFPESNAGAGGKPVPTPPAANPENLP